MTARMRSSSRVRRTLLILAVGGAALVPAISGQPVTISLFAMWALWSMWAWSLNVVWGYAGQFSIAHLALGAASAYTFAILAQRGLPLTVALGSAILVAVVLSMVVGFLSMHLSDFRFAIMTLAFALAVIGVITNSSITGRASGMSVSASLPTIAFGDALTMSFASGSLGLYWALLASVIGLSLSVKRLILTRTGMALLAIREDEILAASVGIYTEKYRIVAFALSAGFASIAGIFHAMWFRFLSPDGFGFSVLVTTILILVLGGRGTILGPFVGAAIFVVFAEGLRIGGEFETALFGALVIVLTIFAQSGLVPLVRDVLRRFWFSTADRGGEDVSLGRMGNSVTPTEPDDAITVRAGEGRVEDVATFDQPTEEGRQCEGRRGQLLLECHGLSKAFGGVKAVHRVNVSVHQNEIVGLIGPNGAGKTTLFNLLSGYIVPDEGQVVWSGQDITHMPTHKRVALGIARTFQHSRSFTNLTVRDNLKIGAHALGGRSETFGSESPERMSESIDPREVAARYALEPSLPDLAGALPYGSSKRLGTAIAAMSNPRILLLDEPAAGLAEGDIASLRDDLRRWKEQGVAVLVVEHHMSLVMAVCDRVLVMDSGEVIAEGRPEAVANDARVIESYLGAPV